MTTRAVWGVLTIALVGLLGLPGVLADQANSPGLRPTADPVLLPVDSHQTDAPSTMRLLGDEPAHETVAGQSRIRVLAANSSDAAENVEPISASASVPPPAVAPPSGPWCFVEDAAPSGQAAIAPIVQATHEGSALRSHNLQRLMASIYEEPADTVEPAPPMPRVLPSLQAMLPPDPMDENSRGLAAPRLLEEDRSVPPRLPPRRTLPDVVPGAPWTDSTPTDQYPPRAVPQVDSPRVEPDPSHVNQRDPGQELEYYSEYAPPQYADSGIDQNVYPGVPGPAVSAGDEPFRLFRPRLLTSRDFTIGGWVDQGITGAANRPADRYNGTVTFNDRCAEYQMNQLYLFLERPTCTQGGGFDLGGRIDLLYGTDARFVKAADGLEARWDQNERFYQLALPQFYFDAALNDLTVRLGHFYSIMGYEVVPGPENFFYSHSYAFQYGEPFTHTGMLASYAVEDGLLVSGGLSRGIDQFDDTDGSNQLGALAAVHWADPEGRRAVQFGLVSGEQGPGNQTTIYSLVGQLRPADGLQWILEHNYGQSVGGNPHGIAKAEWYGLSQYFLCQLTETFALGARVEWFEDVHGTRVRGLGDGNLATGPYPGDFYELTLGLNWQPGPNFLLRPEVRWDWYDGESPAGHRPFDGGQSNRQLLYGFDLIVLF